MIFQVILIIVSILLVSVGVISITLYICNLTKYEFLSQSTIENHKNRINRIKQEKQQGFEVYNKQHQELINNIQVSMKVIDKYKVNLLKLLELLTLYQNNDIKYNLKDKYSPKEDSLTFSYISNGVILQSKFQFYGDETFYIYINRKGRIHMYDTYHMKEPNLNNLTNDRLEDIFRYLTLMKKYIVSLKDLKEDEL